jgi:phosphoglycerol transferase
MSFRVPFSYWGDATFYLMMVKNLVTHGSYLTNSSLGAPFGQQLYDFPQGADNLNLLVIRLLGLFTNDAALVWNLFYLLTYPVVALSALLVLRRLGISRASAFVCSVLFTLLPYHFLRGEGHLLLAAYWAVPLGAYLTLAVLDGKRLFAHRADGRRVTCWLSKTTLLTVGACLVIGSAGLYYAFFTIVLVSAAALVAGVVRRSRAVLLSGLVVVAAISLVLVVNLAPSVLYHRTHGGDSGALARQPAESESYSLKVTELVLPVDGHRIAFLARQSRRYDNTTVLPENQVEAGQTLGTIGDVGFFALLFVALVSCVAAARWRPPSLLRHASFAVIVAFLFGTTSGLATVFAYFVTPNLHVPGRISVFIAFFSLLAVAVLIDAAARRLFAPRRHWLGVFLLPLLAIGIADQTTNDFVPTWAQTKGAWDADAAFGAAVDRVLPKGSMVFQLPYTAFPGYPAPGRMLEYDEGKPYLHTSGIRWSFGAMKGRPQDWAASFASQDPRVYIPAVAAAGFSAIYVDRYGYTDGGSSLERTLRAYLGSPLLLSSDGRYVLYDLRRYTRRLRNRLGSGAIAAGKAATLQPVRLAMGNGFYAPETNGRDTWQWSAAPTVRIGIANPARSPRPVVFSAKIEFPANAVPLDVSYPDGTSSHFAPAETVTIRHLVRAPAGTSDIVVSTAAQPVSGIGGDPRTLYMQFIDTRAVDRSLLRLASSR